MGLTGVYLVAEGEDPLLRYLHSGRQKPQDISALLMLSSTRQITQGYDVVMPWLVNLMKAQTRWLDSTTMRLHG